MASKRSMEKRATRTDDLEVVDFSGLMDVDWAEINKIRRACEIGGSFECPNCAAKYEVVWVEAPH
jgi:hypothetical protein